MLTKDIPAAIARELKVQSAQVGQTIALLDEGNTVPFIARYRKEATGSLEDEQIRHIEERLTYLRNLVKRQEEILTAIDGQGKLTDELRHAIEKAAKLQELEDLYLPYKQKKRTRAQMARERGLEPLANAMLLQAQWSKVGVNVTLDQRESTAYSDARKKGEMDLIISGWSDDIQDPTQLMQFVFDYSVTSGYYSFYQQPDDMLKLNSEATVETDVEKRKDLYRQIQEGLRDQYIFIPLYTTPWQNAIRRNVSGFVQTPLGNYRFADLTK